MTSSPSLHISMEFLGNLGSDTSRWSRRLSMKALTRGKLSSLSSKQLFVLLTIPPSWSILSTVRRYDSESPVSDRSVLKDLGTSRMRRTTSLRSQKNLAYPGDSDIIAYRRLANAQRLMHIGLFSSNTPFYLRFRTSLYVSGLEMSNFFDRPSMSVIPLDM